MMRHLAIASTVIFVLAFGVQAKAHIELNGFYTSESLNLDSSTTSNRMFFEAAIGFAIDKKAKYLVGWNYSMFTTTDATTTTQKYSSTQMGPRFLWFIDKDRQWSLGLGYYLVTNATYDSGSGTSEKWKGTALKFDIGYNFPINEYFLAGVRFNYSSATYVERLIGDTTYSTVSYTKSLMYPSLYLVYIF